MNVVTITWMSRRRGGNMPTLTATIPQSIPVQELLNQAIDVNKPVESIFNTVGAYIRVV